MKRLIFVSALLAISWTASALDPSQIIRNYDHSMLIDSIGIDHYEQYVYPCYFFSTKPIDSTANGMITYEVASFSELGKYGDKLTLPFGLRNVQHSAIIAYANDSNQYLYDLQFLYTTHTPAEEEIYDDLIHRVLFDIESTFDYYEGSYKMNYPDYKDVIGNIGFYYDGESIKFYVQKLFLNRWFSIPIDQSAYFADTLIVDSLRIADFTINRKQYLVPLAAKCEDHSPRKDASIRWEAVMRTHNCKTTLNQKRNFMAHLLDLNNTVEYLGKLQLPNSIRRAHTYKVVYRSGKTFLIAIPRKLKEQPDLEETRDEEIIYYSTTNF